MGTPHPHHLNKAPLVPAMTSLGKLRVAAQRRATIQTKLNYAHAEFVQEIKEAKAAGASEKDLEAATGLTRQRIWQITKEN